MNSFIQKAYLINSDYIGRFSQSVYLTSLNWFKSSGDFIWNSFTHNISIHFIISGKGVMEYKSKKHYVSKGDWFIFWPNEHIKYYDFPSTPWEYYWFSLSGYDVSQTLVSLGLTPESPHIKRSSASSLFFAGIHAAIENIKHRNYSNIYGISLAWEFLNILSMAIEEQKGEKHIKRDIAYECKEIIESSMEKNISVENIANELNVDRTTLFRIFKQKFGMSPKEYIDNKRFALACMLLKRHKYSIKEISYICGFSEQRYFSRAFCKRFGVCPSQYREEKHTQK